MCAAHTYTHTCTSDVQPRHRQATSSACRLHVHTHTTARVHMTHTEKFDTQTWIHKLCHSTNRTQCLALAGRRAYARARKHTHTLIPARKAVVGTEFLGLR